jgi:hypothetical protein
MGRGGALNSHRGHLPTRGLLVALAALALSGGSLGTGSCASGEPAATTTPSVESSLAATTPNTDRSATTQSIVILDDEDLHPVGVGDKMGYIDGGGAMVIEPRFQRAETFSEGLGRAGVGDSQLSFRWGYIDKTGTWVIEPQFGEGLGAFTEGLALVDGYNPDGTSNYGYIDKTGAWAIEPRFPDAEPFSEGLALVSTLDEQGNGRYGFIDKTGTWAIEPQFDLGLSFTEGLAAVRVPDEHDILRWGFIDKTGAWVMEPQFAAAYAFSEGLAFVSAEPGPGGYTSGCIDKTGAWVFKLNSPEELGGWDVRFSEGLAAMWVDTKKTYTLRKWGYLDKTGAWAIEPQFDFAHDFSEGRAVVSMDTVADAANPSRVGYIDKTGAWVVEPQYFSGDPFSGGLAMVAPWYDEIPDWGMWYPPDKYRYIDETGKVIWPGG